MANYSETDFDRIAHAIRAPLADVENYAERFEGAARFLRIDRGIAVGAYQPRARPAPFERRKSMERIAASARRFRNNLANSAVRRNRLEESYARLLQDLRIGGPDALADGPADPDIFELLAYPDGSDEDSVLALLVRLDGPDTADRIAAAEDLELLAVQAAAKAVSLGDLTTPEGNSGDRALNDWIATMLDMYVAITRREPATSVGSPGGKSDGQASGPLIRFLGAAGRPLGIKLSAEAWRGRVREARALAKSVQN